jgi:hypothetical protein
MGIHTTREKRINCRMPLIKAMEAKEFVSSNDAQPAAKGRRR